MFRFRECGFIRGPPPAAMRAALSEPRIRDARNRAILQSRARGHHSSSNTGGPDVSARPSRHSLQPVPVNSLAHVTRMRHRIAQGDKQCRSQQGDEHANSGAAVGRRQHLGR